MPEGAGEPSDRVHAQTGGASLPHPAAMLVVAAQGMHNPKTHPDRSNRDEL